MHVLSRSNCVATLEDAILITAAASLGRNSPLSLARVIHNRSPEWLKIKEVVEKARDVAVLEADEVGEVTCLELLKALELS
ncbi:hypothetical protein Tco_0901289 [Tanacetum coccineum]